MTEYINRSSVERDREKSQSDERSIIHHGFGAKGKVSVESETPQTPLIEALKDKTADVAALGYQIRPKFGERFSPEAVRSVIQSVLEDFFSARKNYDHDKVEGWVEQVAKEVLARVRQFNYPRYKFITHVHIGERIGGGINIGMKCMWDADTDHYATYTYLGDSVLCVITVCGVYCY